MTTPIIGGQVGFTFSKYGPEEKAKLADAIRSLSVRSAGKELPLPDVCSPLEEAWLIGTLEQVIQKADEITKNTVKIGLRFLKRRRDDPSRMKSFFWSIERPDPCLTSLLVIVLELVSPDPDMGPLGLEQVILRTGDDEFVYWGVG